VKSSSDYACGPALLLQAAMFPEGADEIRRLGLGPAIARGDETLAALLAFVLDDADDEELTSYLNPRRHGDAHDLLDAAIKGAPVIRENASAVVRIAAERVAPHLLREHARWMADMHDDLLRYALIEVVALLLRIGYLDHADLAGARRKAVAA